MRISLFINLFLLFLSTIYGQATAHGPRNKEIPKLSKPSKGHFLKKTNPQNCRSTRSSLLLGIDVLQTKLHFSPLKGLRVGLLTHNAAVNGEGKRTVDIFIDEKEVNLTTIFSPEHGLEGKVLAAKKVADSHERRSNIPIYSLYGATRIPTEAMLKAIDILVVDLQDIGVRSYTFISCMRYAVEACWSKSIPVLILDRPNPLGGLKRGGPGIDYNQMSYVGAFKIPYVHGLTMGELGKMLLQDKEGHPELVNLRKHRCSKPCLDVIKMEGWKRSMLWQDTGLKWHPTSPNIPSLASAFGYAMTGIGCIKGRVKNGIGTPYPFRLLSGNNLEESKRLQTLLSQNTPASVLFKWVDQQALQGSYLKITDWNLCDPSAVILHLMQCASMLEGENLFKNLSAKENSLAQHILGENNCIEKLERFGLKLNNSGLLDDWKQSINNFQISIKKFLLY